MSVLQFQTLYIFTSIDIYINRTAGKNICFFSQINVRNVYKNHVYTLWRRKSINVVNVVNIFVVRADIRRSILLRTHVAFICD